MALLIVEDNPVSVKLMENFLNNRGYSTYCAQNGKEALAILQSRHRKIELILLDIMMPEMDGFEFLKIKHGHSSYQSIPVIVCTALSGMEMVKKAVDFGCKFYVIKPVNMSNLQEKILTVLGKKGKLSNGSDQVQQQDLQIDLYREVVCSFSEMVIKKVDLINQAIEHGINPKKDVDFSDLSEASICFGAKWVNAILENLSKIYDQLKWENPDSEIKRHIKEKLIKLVQILPVHHVKKVPDSEYMMKFFENAKTVNTSIDIQWSVLLKNYTPNAVKLARITELIPTMILIDPVVDIDGDVICDAGCYLKDVEIASILQMYRASNLIEPVRVVSTEMILAATLNKDDSVEEDFKPEALSDEQESNEQIVDFELALQYVEGNAELLQQMLQDFIPEIPNYIQLLYTHLQNKDMPNLEKIAHRFKTNFHHFGSIKLFELIEELEDTACLADMQEARQLLLRIDQLVTEFIEVITGAK